MEYRHGEIVPSSSICVICMCYYGEVVCSTEKCPPLKIGCRRINTEETCCGKIVCGTKNFTTKRSLKKPLIEECFFKNCLNRLCCSLCFNFNFLRKGRSHCEMYFCSTISWYIIDLTQKKWNYFLFNPQSFV